MQTDSGKKDGKSTERTQNEYGNPTETIRKPCRNLAGGNIRKPQRNHMETARKAYGNNTENLWSFCWSSKESLSAKTSLHSKELIDDDKGSSFFAGRAGFLRCKSSICAESACLEPTCYFQVLNLHWMEGATGGQEDEKKNFQKGLFCPHFANMSTLENHVEGSRNRNLTQNPLKPVMTTSKPSQKSGQVSLTFFRVRQTTLFKHLSKL